VAPHIDPRPADEPHLVVHFQQSRAGAIHGHEPTIGLQNLNAVTGGVEDAAIDPLAARQLLRRRLHRALGAQTSRHLTLECVAAALETAVHRRGNHAEDRGEQQSRDRKYQRDPSRQARLFTPLPEQRLLGRLHVSCGQPDAIHLLIAGIRGDSADRIRRTPGLMFLDGGLQLVETIAAEPAELHRALALTRIIRFECGEGGGRGGDPRPRVLIGLEQRGATREQILARAVLGIEKTRDELVYRADRLMRAIDVGRCR
jgi:hypothetical protein